MVVSAFFDPHYSFCNKFLCSILWFFHAVVIVYHCIDPQLSVLLPLHLSCNFSYSSFDSWFVCLNGLSSLLELDVCCQRCLSQVYLCLALRKQTLKLDEASTDHLVICNLSSLYFSAWSSRDLFIFVPHLATLSTN